MALPGKIKPLRFVAGDTFVKKVTLFENFDDAGVPENPIDLTGSSARAQIRSSAESSDVLAEFVIQNADDFSNDGVIIIRLESAQTSVLVTGKSSPLVGVWDLEVTNTDGDVRTWLAGAVIVNPDVTRD